MTRLARRWSRPTWSGQAAGHSRTPGAGAIASAVAVLSLMAALEGVERQGSQVGEPLPSPRAVTPTATDDSKIGIWRVQGNVYMLVGAGANITVQVGSLGPVVVDSGLKEHGDDVLAAIRTLSNKPIRFIINTHAHEDHVGANERLAASGAGVSSRTVTVVGAGEVGRPDIVAHEQVLSRMSGATPARAVGAWPSSTFSSMEKEFFYNGEGVQIVHQPAAHTDGDSIVFFRRSDVIAAGDSYSTVSYPIIDVELGGSITGTLNALNRLLALVISGEKVEGGTMIVPGHGRVSDEADLVEYRDMVTIIRDRVEDLIKKGRTLAQVKAARPTLEYDKLYGSARGWTSDQFVEAVYRGLQPARAVTR
jgi:cyclase